MYDIAIVGGGPAGATLARLIGNTFKVLLIDRREFIEEKAGSFEKCCGGLIAPDAQNMLGRFGLGVPEKVMVGPQLFSVRTMDLQNNVERFYQRHYINIDREKFDSWMVSLIPSSVEIRGGTIFKSYEQAEDHLKINLSQRGIEYVEKAKILVGADGAFSKVRRQLAPMSFRKKYVSIQEYFKVEEALPYFSAIFDEEITDFYAWTIPKEDYLIVGAAIPENYCVNEKFDLLKTKLAKLGFDLNHRLKRNGCHIIRPKTGEIYLGDKNITLIGEAAGWISPTSAEGLSYSFRSALALARSLIQSNVNFRAGYVKNSKSLKLNIGLKNLKGPFMYNPMIRKAVMKSSLTSMDIIDANLTKF